MDSSVEKLKEECALHLQKRLAAPSFQDAINSISSLDRAGIFRELEEASKLSKEPLNSLACLCHSIATSGSEHRPLCEALVQGCIKYFDSALQGDKDVTKEALQVTQLAYHAMSLLIKEAHILEFTVSQGELFERFLRGSINLINWCETWKSQVGAEFDPQSHADLTECLKELSLATVAFFNVAFTMENSVATTKQSLVQMCLDCRMSKDWVIVLCRRASLKYSWMFPNGKVTIVHKGLPIEGTLVSIKGGRSCIVRANNDNVECTLDSIKKHEDNDAVAESISYSPFLDLLDRLIVFSGFEKWFGALSERAQQKMVSKLSSFSLVLKSFDAIKELSWYKETMEKRKGKREERRKKRKRQQDEVEKTIEQKQAENTVQSKIKLVENLDSGAEALLRLWESKDIIPEVEKLSCLLTDGKLAKLLVSARTRARTIQPTRSLLYTDPVPWGGIAPAETIATAAAIEGVLILGRLLGKDPEILSKQNSILRYSTLAASGSVIFTLGEVAKRLANGEVVLDATTGDVKNAPGAPNAAFSMGSNSNMSNQTQAQGTSSKPLLDPKTSQLRTAKQSAVGQPAGELQETPPQLEQPPSIDSPNFKALEGDILKSSIHPKGPKFGVQDSSSSTMSKLSKHSETEQARATQEESDDASTESESEAQQKPASLDIVAI